MRVGEWRYSSTHSLTSALDEGEWSTSRPGRFTPGERVPGTHWIGGWVGPRAVVDAVVKRKIPSHRRESKPRNSIVQFVAQRYTDWAIIIYKSKTTVSFALFTFNNLPLPPITVAMRSKAHNVLDRSNAGIAGSSFARGKNKGYVCVSLCCIV
jgi:hypothetical protein